MIAVVTTSLLDPRSEKKNKPWQEILVLLIQETDKEWEEDKGTDCVLHGDERVQTREKEKEMMKKQSFHSKDLLHFLALI